MQLMLPSPKDPGGDWFCVHTWSPEEAKTLDLAFSAASCIYYGLGTHMWPVTQISQMTQDNFLSHSGKTLSEPKGYEVNCRKPQMIKYISD